MLGHFTAVTVTSTESQAVSFVNLAAILLLLLLPLLSSISISAAS